MDAARERAAEHPGGGRWLLVSAREQTRGKGTRGRAWMAAPGNIYMTIGIRRDALPRERLALLPLELGLHLWDEAASRADAAGKAGLTLKWPNDLLLRGRKAGGILVESQGDWLLAGFGVNLAAAPEVRDGGSAPASLAEAGVDAGLRLEIIEGIFRRLREAPNGEEYDPEAVLLRWQGKVDWNRAHRLRDRAGTPEVLPLSVNSQGHLRVRHSDGTVEWLVSDYLA